MVALSAGGCRSCDSCHDYDSPVADCQCESCGYGRSGSASGGYVASGDQESDPTMTETEVGYE
jgi:hypothetical protein